MKNNAWRLIGLGILLTVWQLAAVILNTPLLLPPLQNIADSFIAMLKTQQSYIQIGTTIMRVLVTIIFSTILALLFGLPAGTHERFENIFFASENFLRAVPTAAVIVLALIWFKSGVTPIFVASLIIFPLIYRSITDAIKHIDSRFLELSNDFSVVPIQRIRFLYLPHALFALRTSLVSAVGLAMKVVVMAELLSQPQHGIGVELQLAKVQLNTAGIFAWAILTVVLAILLQAFSKMLVVQLYGRKKHNA